MTSAIKIKIKVPLNAASINISGLSADSRKVQPGYLFAALPGISADGRSFIGDAIKNGAAVVLASEDTAVPQNTPLATSPDPRAALAHLAAAFYSSQPRTIAAVTGTNGKTSTIDFTRQIWDHLGHKATSIGTLGLQPGLSTPNTNLTTPDPISLHAELSGFAASGITHVAIEASSHGLDQRRMDGVMLRAAGFTNFTHDHMDYHVNTKNYLSAKKRLFAELLPASAIAVLNADAEEYGVFAKSFKGEKLTYGRSSQDLTLKSATATKDGTRLKLDILGSVFDLKLPLMGLFQSYNVLCAAGIAIGCGASIDKVMDSLTSLVSVPGRVQLAGHISGGRVYVDYAHTPDAVEQVLTSMRLHTRGRLIIILGCGGDRDASKRSLMGKVTDEHADYTIITDDNPRSENPAKIRKEMMVDAPRAHEISDRAKAIAAGISMINQDDVLIIAGKGHEKVQIVGKEAYPFDDLMAARQEIQKGGGNPL